MTKLDIRKKIDRYIYHENNLPIQKMGKRFMDKNRIIKAFIISIILATTSIAISPSGIALTTFHTIQGTLYVDDEVADPGVEIKLTVGSFVRIIETEQPDQGGYNYAAGFDHATYGGMTVQFKVKYKGSFVSPVDNASIVLDKDTENVERYIVDLHVNESSPSGDDDDDSGGDDDDDSGGGGGSSSGGGGGSTIVSPTADANGPYSGFIDEEITFDGSGSTDDGTITNFTWDFGDGNIGYGETTTHIYSSPDLYTVTLTVTDNEGAKDTDGTTALISQPNLPPTNPEVYGPTSGTKNTEYTYTALSSDPDNDSIQYTFEWGDDNITETEFLPNGTAADQDYSWESAGKYTIKVNASDNQNASSGTTEYIVLIDVHIVDDIGYLIDDDADGTYDCFHNDTSGQEYDVEKQDDGTYLIDDDGDGSWDWIYDIETGTLTKYSGEPTTELDSTTIIVLVIIVILILIILGYLVKRSNDKKKAQKKAAEKKSVTKKKNTGKKSKK